MELKDIKRGDMLVAHYGDDDIWPHKKRYIIFIANGDPVEKGYAYDSRHTHASISTLAHIDLAGCLCVGSKHPNGKPQSIGIVLLSDDAANADICVTKIKKPTIAEYMEMMNKLAECGYRFNRFTKEIEKINGTKSKTHI